MNLYYEPQEAGLEIVADIDWYDEPYEFDMTVVWKDQNGNFYMADDSGCSCPSPFEDYTSVKDLDGPHDAAGIASALKYRLKDRLDDSYRPRSEAELTKEINDIISKLDNT